MSETKHPPLSKVVGWGHIVSVALVYGLVQGVGETVSFRGRDYYFKNDMGLNPADSQFYRTIAHIPWNVKPFFGFFSDAVPVFGYHLKPHILLAAIFGIISFSLLAILPTQGPFMATTLLLLTNIAMASPDVAIDAANSRLTTAAPWIASDLQSLCAVCFLCGALLGSGTSGVIADAGGASAMFGACVLTSVAALVAGFVLVEPRGARHDMPICERVGLVFKTLRHPIVSRLITYICISHSMPFIDQAMFFWYQDTSVGPGFSKQFIGMMDLVAFVGMLCGVLAYNRFFTTFRFFNMFAVAQVLVVLTSLLDLPFVLRLNTKIGIPDQAFALTDSALFKGAKRLQFLPFAVIVAKICPDEIAGTMFATLMSLSNFAEDIGNYAGSFMIDQLHITSTDFSNLWLAVLLRSLLRLLPLCFLWLIPRDLDASCDIHAVHEIVSHEKSGTVATEIELRATEHEGASLIGVGQQTSDKQV